MQGDRYSVQRGDNLWRIARARLGSGREWPRIWRHNNRPEVVRITGRAVPNPDLIYVGQLLLIPRFAAEPLARTTTPVATSDHLPAAVDLGAPPAFTDRMSSGQEVRARDSLADQVQRLRIPVAYKFELGQLKWPPQTTPTATIRISMTGDVLLASQQSYPASYVVSGGKLEGQLTTEANHAFGKLVSENSYAYEPAEKRITLKSMLVSQSNTPNAPTTAVGVELASDTALPSLRAEIKLPKLDGVIGVFRYVATDVAFVLEVTPHPTIKKQLDSAQELRVVAISPAAKASARSAATAELVIGAGIVVGAVAIMFGSVVEDFFTFGLGLLNDAPSMALGAAAIAKGVSMMRQSPSAGLPQAIAPASVNATTRINVVGGYR